MEDVQVYPSYLDYMGRKVGNFNRQRPTKVIIDSDPGGDDAQAIVLAIHLARKYKAEILGVTLIAGNGALEDVVKNA